MSTERGRWAPRCARALGDKQLLLSDADEDGMSQHLLLVDRTLHLVSSQQPAAVS